MEDKIYTSDFMSDLDIWNIHFLDNVAASALILSKTNKSISVETTLIYIILL